MIIIRLTSRYYLCLIYSLLFLGVNSSNYGRYQEAIVGEHTELECSSDRDVYTLTWTHVPTGSDDIYSVFVGQYPSERYADRFSLNVLTSGRYNLLIKDVQKRDAGNFTCRMQDHQEDDVAQFVSLTVLETQPICHSTVISKHYNNSGSSCIENDKLRLLCKVKYVGDIPPTLIWKNISNKNNTKSVRDGNNEVHNSIEVTTNWNQFIFVCETASSQRHCYSVGQRPLYAFETLTEKRLNGPQKVTCIANSSDICRQSWLLRDEDKVLHAGQELELTFESPSDIYICKTECQFEGGNCILRSLLINFDNGNQSKYMSYICLSIVFVLATILVIILLQYLYRRRSKICSRCATFRKLRNNGTTHNNDTQLQLLNGTNYEEQPDPQLIKPEYFGNVRRIQFDNDGSARNIKGLAFSGDTIYVARFSINHIDTYDKSTLAKTNTIPVNSLEQARDLAVCPRNGCLYISDGNEGGRRGIHSVTLRCITLRFWKTKEIPEGISITVDGDILVSFPFAHEIIIYSHADSRAELRKIQMPDRFTHLRQTIQLDDSRYLVCYGGLGNIPDMTNGVVVFNVDTEETTECDYIRERITTSIARPVRMAVTSTGHIFVATYHGKEILLLDSELRYQGTLLTLHDKSINRMCYDETNRCLYIADHGEVGTVHICELSREYYVEVLGIIT